MRRIKIPEYLTIAIQNIYARTTSLINGKQIESSVGLRQGCPLSPILFALYISDIEKVMSGQQEGGVVIGSRLKIHTLCYADDLVIWAHTAKELQAMMGTLHKYACKRSLTVNAEKNQIYEIRQGRKIIKHWDTF